MKDGPTPADVALKICDVSFSEAERDALERQS